MKYKSDLIKDIVDTRGHVKSSLHYESECIEAWIEETKGAYPKLCDYESEWLNYMTLNEIGKFPYVTVSANPTAMVNNVIPYAYKSAILRGSTLVNLINEPNKNITSHWGVFKTINNLKENTNYTISIEKSDVQIGVYTSSESIIKKYTNGTFSFNTQNNTLVKLFVRQEENTTSIPLPDEYWKIVMCEGDYTNVDIPYFEGMQSVKMPVLTTSNEDGTKTNILTVNKDVTLRGIGDVKDALDCLTGELTERIGEVVLDGSEDWEQDYNGFTRFRTQIQNGYPHTSRSEIVSNFFPFMSSGNSYPLAFIYGSYLYVYLEENTTVDSLKEWLKENKPTIQYKLETPTIKTVDLTVVNQDNETLDKIKPLEGIMYINVTGNPINPNGVFEIPVEAITQNLSSFIKEQ